MTNKESQATDPRYVTISITVSGRTVDERDDYALLVVEYAKSRARKDDLRAETLIDSGPT